MLRTRPPTWLVESERCWRGSGSQESCILYPFFRMLGSQGRALHGSVSWHVGWILGNARGKSKGRRQEKRDQLVQAAEGWPGPGRQSQECGGARGLRLYLETRAFPLTLQLYSGHSGGCVLCRVWVLSHSCDGQFPGTVALSYVSPVWKLSSCPQISTVWSTSWRPLFWEERPTLGHWCWKDMCPSALS